jgi:hypothetical protein
MVEAGLPEGERETALTMEEMVRRDTIRINIPKKIGLGSNKIDFNLYRIRGDEDYLKLRYMKIIFIRI